MRSMTAWMRVIAFAVTICTARFVGAQTDSVRLRYPLTKTEAVRTPTFVVDLSEVPDDPAAQEWAGNAKELCEEWFPVICKFLATEQWTAPETVRLAIKSDLKNPGSTSGNTISISHKWVTSRPDDFGMVIHELVHIVQNYPPSKTNPGWLVEGIADYIRYWKYESEAPRQRIAATASYTNGYGTTGSFLAWLVWKYDRRLVRTLDAALRKNEYNDEMFRDLTGKELPDLWAEFLQTQPGT